MAIERLPIVFNTLSYIDLAFLL